MVTEGYDFAAMQRRWQPVWQSLDLFTPRGSGERRYVVDMFAYPSGDLHMGHAEAYAFGDAIARYWIQRGYDVLHPVGWDSFGLPAENAAIRRDQHPADWTYANIATQAESFRRYAVSVDWRTRLHTSDPSYYRWTQWLFLRFFERGLAYRARSAVNWCPADQTVLANEQVTAGRCERCGTTVIRRDLTQWFFRITSYADRLLADMDALAGHWPDRVLTMQRNWIGRSRGAYLEFSLPSSGPPEATPPSPGSPESTPPSSGPPGPPSSGPPESSPHEAGPPESGPHEASPHEASPHESGPHEASPHESGPHESGPHDEDRVLTVFATRPDTVLGATFLVVAPDSPLAADLCAPSQREALASYAAIARQTAEADRTAADRPKTGVPLGRWALHPFTGARIPIWAADYVLAAHGTGAIMAVPSHDDRDRAFAEAFGLPIVDAPLLGDSPFASHSADPNSPGRNPASDDTHSAATNSPRRDPASDDTHSVAADSSGRDPASDRAHSADANAPGQAAAPDPVTRPRSVDAHFPGQAAASDRVDGPRSADADSSGCDLAVEQAIAIVEGRGVGRAGVSYRLRDWLISRQRFWGCPIPIVRCPACGEVPVPDDQLPVTLPDMRGAELTPRGESPLAANRAWSSVPCPRCGGPGTRDTDTMDTFVDSSWYFLRYPSIDYTDGPFDPEATRRWLPVDQYIGGIEHATMHVLYARFFTKVLHDLGLVDFVEPFRNLLTQGQLILNGAAMSKSKGNVVDLGDQLATYGVDAVRLTMVFAGPPEDDIDWADVSPAGATRFLSRALRLSDEVATPPTADSPSPTPAVTPAVSSPAVAPTMSSPAGTPTRSSSDGAPSESSPSGAPSESSPGGVPTKSSPGGTPGPSSAGVASGASSAGVASGASSAGVTSGASSAGVTSGASSGGIARGASSGGVASGASVLAMRRTTHRLLREITALMEAHRFNVAVARTMQLANASRKAIDEGGAASPAVREAVEAVAVVLSLFTPYTAEEMWARLGHEPGIARAGWPTIDPTLAAEPTTICAVQINGKLRDRLEVPSDITEDALTARALASPAVAATVNGRPITRTIVRLPKLINLVVPPT